MKKQVKKLELAKETLRSLEKSTLRKVAGASPTDEYWSCRVCYDVPYTEGPNCY